MVTWLVTAEPTLKKNKAALKGDHKKTRFFLDDIVPETDPLPFCPVRSNFSNRGINVCLRIFALLTQIEEANLRTFLFCPVETSEKNVSKVFSLWVNYMEPWADNLDEFPETHENTNSLKRDSTKEVNIYHPCEYSSSWQGLVLSNYLFYVSLVMHVIGLLISSFTRIQTYSADGIQVCPRTAGHKVQG
ncbi:hypothetical protein L1987_66608 [Smallanthus sonchifolius]|uniref:Uncharacterized protein n=1 Tax=Smallanthus sonchifolius TaxID=185202 RepID=A0ACB9BXT1_9ASTR|nr:hypothetical protein L1987_66608 [Smallanthus sonchifolius]